MIKVYCILVGIGIGIAIKTTFKNIKEGFRWAKLQNRDIDFEIRIAKLHEEQIQQRREKVQHSKLYTLQK
tara:strand:+ start:1072 stop:1281 length:210 start_codon:yes stop_codon:yes gene_type:complete